jgi:hypothetical protein
MIEGCTIRLCEDASAFAKASADETADSLLYAARETVKTCVSAKRTGLVLMHFTM